MLLASGQFPYPFRPGMDLDLTGELIPNWNPKSRELPGIMAISWIPSFGNSSQSTDPASIAGKEFYGRVRAAYSGALDADAPDFMVYVGGLDSIFSYIGWLKRLYRAVSTYSAENFLLPNALIRAFGISTDKGMNALRTQKVRLWQGINEMILMSRKFKCPAVMDLFNRHYWMSDNVYADAPSTRAQMYVFNLCAVYKTQQVTEAGSGTESVQGLQLTEIPYLNADETIVDKLLQFGYDLIRAFDEWDDSYTISGYLQRAFDNVPSFTVAELLQDELITAQYVPEVLMQIENLRAVAPYGYEWYTILRAMAPTAIVTQNTLTNAVVSNVNFSKETSVSDGASTWMYRLLSHMPGGVVPTLNMHTETPTVADSVIASRLHAYTRGTASYNESTKKYTFSYEITGGTELVLSLKVFTNKLSYLVKQVFVQEFYNPDSTGLNDRYLRDDAPDVTQQFDQHPLLFGVTIGSPADKTVEVQPMCDVFNITKITPEMLANLHKVCFYSELNSFSI